MLIAAFIALFICAAVLVWQGTLPAFPGFVIAAFSLGTLLWTLIRALQKKNGIHREMRERKAKWGGELLVVTGLSSLIGSRCQLFITRQDKLILDDGAGQRVIPLSDVLRLGLFYGESLETLNDFQMGDALKFGGTPHFSAVRAWLAHNPGARKTLMLAVRLQKPLNQLEYSEMAVFSDLAEMGNLKAFALRPEIAVKLTFIPRSSKRRLRKKDSRADRPLQDEKLPGSGPSKPHPPAARENRNLN